VERLTFRALSFVSESEVDLVLDADDGTPVTWRFVRAEHGGIGVINGPEEFASKYRQVPGPSFPDWPEALVRAAFAARREPLPAGVSAQKMTDEARARITKDWDEQHG